MKTQALQDAEDLNRTLKKTVRNYQKLSGGLPSASGASARALSKQIVSEYRGGRGT